MRKILITGANSYIGNCFKEWLKQWPNDYLVESISVRGDSWKGKSFARYDTLLHLAGIAHVSTNPRMENVYYKVNRDLAIEVAKKAKIEGIKQFIFMSSILIYVDGTGKIEIINRDTKPSPRNFYGKSKLQAEEGIMKLRSNDFKVAILRPPMVYGKGCKGNYPKLSKIARKTPVFPDYENFRSMLYIDNLCEFIRLIVDNEECGVYFPQNSEYVKVSNMVKLISQVHGKKLILTKIFNPVIRLLCKHVMIINKVFGNLIYEMSMSDYKVNYRIKTLEESIIETENNKEESA